MSAAQRPSKRHNASLLSHVLPKLRPFQKEALEFATQGKIHERQFNPLDEDDGQQKQAATTSSARQEAQRKPQGRLLLGDEMGLGKSLTALAIMAYYEPEWPLLIFCPASLKYTWTAEIEKWFPTLKPSDMYVAAGFSDVAFGPMVAKKQIKAVVVSYSLLQKRSAVAQLLYGDDCHFSCIIADESHNLKERTSQRSQLIEPVLNRAKRLILLSGTPALARPAELWTQVSCLDPDKQIFPPTWTAFANRYCAPKRIQFGPGRSRWDYTGSSNMRELHGKLISVMVRRLKADVLQELPPKQRSVVELLIAPSEKAACENAIKELKESKKSVEDLVGQTGAERADFKAKGCLVKAYQQTGIGKAESVANYLLDWLAGSGQAKVLVFCHHAAVMDKLDHTLLRHYPNSHIRIDGSVSSDQRAGLVHQFQTVKNIRVGLLSVTAAGVGLTLTAASTVMFAELHWTPGVLAQAEDRAHRIGQVADSVQIVYLVCRNDKFSVDGALWSMLGKKISTLDQVVDGKKAAPYLHGARESPSKSELRVPARSVTQEVAAFFADASSKQKPVVVKGSIKAFFQAATNGSNKKAMNTPTLSSSSKKKAPTVKSAPISMEAPHSTPPPSKRARTTNDSVVWACDACTFENAVSPRDSGWYACQMCGNPYNHAATSESSRSCTDESKRQRTQGKGDVSVDDKNQVEWKCPTCTTDNSRPATCTGWYSCVSCEESYMRPSSRSTSGDDYDSDSNFDELINSSPLFRKSAISVTHQPARVSLSAKATRADILDVDGDEGNVLLSSPQVINLADSPCPSPVQQQSTRRCTGRQRSHEIVIVDDEDNVDENTSCFVSSRSTTTPLLLFSISKHSGMVTIHYAASGHSSLVNFVTDEIVTAEVAAELLRAKVKRTLSSASTRKPLEVTFDMTKLSGVVQRLHDADVHGKMYQGEIRAFVTSYLRLRSVEQKALQESGETFGSHSLAQQAAQLMGGASIGGSGKVRYAGGAKERAREAVEQGTASQEDQNVLMGYSCAWCSHALSKASRRAGVVYCTQACAEQGRLRRGGMYSSANLRQAVFGLEGGVCTICGINARALFEQVCALEPPERLNKLLSVKWRLPKSKPALESLLEDPKEGSFWQVDHIKAVAEGGGDAGLDNLRTLCVPCHLTETEKLHRRLALQSPDEKKDDPSVKRRQIDIRSAFKGGSVTRMQF